MLPIPPSDALNEDVNLLIEDLQEILLLETNYIWITNIQVINCMLPLTESIGLILVQEYGSGSDNRVTDIALLQKIF